MGSFACGCFVGMVTSILMKVGSPFAALALPADPKPVASRQRLTAGNSAVFAVGPGRGNLQFTRIGEFPLLESTMFVLLSYMTFLLGEAAGT